MSARILEAQHLLARVPFPDMELGANGQIIAADGRVICAMNLKHLTLPEAFAFAKAFIAAGEAIGPGAKP